jgi:hypothetical protein
MDQIAEDAPEQGSSDDGGFVVPGASGRGGECQAADEKGSESEMEKMVPGFHRSDSFGLRGLGSVPVRFM